MRKYLVKLVGQSLLAHEGMDALVVWKSISAGWCKFGRSLHAEQNNDERTKMTKNANFWLK